MGDAGDDLRFDRAAYEDPSSSATRCAACKAPIEGQYWQVGAHVLCDKCRGSVAATFARSQSAAAFGKAALLGGLAALGCGAAYAVFVGVVHAQMSLITIGIAYAVATAIRRGSGGLGGVRFQVLAVVLTYVASTMGYLPAILSALREETADTGRTIFLAMGTMLAAPFLELTSSPLGVLIIAFGLWEAWRRSRGVPVTLQGPFRVAGP